MNVAGGQLVRADFAEAPAHDARDWFTAAELAELTLPGIPVDKRSVNRRASEESWALRCAPDGSPLARARSGRGGGTEFHISLLPATARIELAARGITASGPEPQAASPAIAGSWRWYEAQSGKVRTEAERRLAVVSEIDLLCRSGLTRTAAVSEVSRIHAIGASTLWAWLSLVGGLARSDWLPALAPRRQGGGKEADIDPDLWRVFKSDYLRPSAPTLASCYARVADIARSRGLSIPSEQTMRRRLEREVAGPVLVLLRKGEEALRRSIPSQRRTVDHLHAMECVNIDGHKFDVFVTPPAGGKPVRPVMVAIQDIRSSKFLAWRVAETESAVHVRLAFADLFEGFGIPKECVLDNGRGFASKWITGGSKNRFRFKVRDEDPTGLLTALGIVIHWALPYRGQSKPIERAFRDIASTIATHPATEGAYTGNSPESKPHNYGKRALGWTEFCQLVDRGMAAHNARAGRKGRDYRGRSFDQVFAESYATAPIGKATPEQLRMALLAAEQKMVNSRTGEIELFGNRYWSEESAPLHGQKVTVRFDPDNLMRDIHLYALDGRYLASARVIEDTGFLDAAAAKTAGRRWANYRKLTRAAAEAEQLLTASEVADLQVDAPAFVLPEASVVRPVRHRGQTAAALKSMSTPAPVGGAVVDRMRKALSLRLVSDD